MILSPAEALERATKWSSITEIGGSDTPAMVVDFRGLDRSFVIDDQDKQLASALVGSPWVNIAVVDDDMDAVFAPLIDVFDVVLGDQTMSEAAVDVDDVDDATARLFESIRASPLAAVELVRLLRTSHDQPIAQALHAESVTYGLLQTSEHFRRWLDDRSGRRLAAGADDPTDAGPPKQNRSSGHQSVGLDSAVSVERTGSLLTITLDRPERRNALNVAMRDQLFEALELLDADRSIDGAVLRGTGESFCAGGDLGEFGTTPSAAVGHSVRMQRSLPQLIDRVKGRLRVELHGPCVGAGVELASFAGSVIADPNTTFCLPEVGFGLVPGAGGTVGVARRCGRYRTAWLALTGSTIDADLALRWQLVDRIARP